MQMNWWLVGWKERKDKDKVGKERKKKTVGDGRDGRMDEWLQEKGTEKREKTGMKECKIEESILYN